MSDSQLQNVIYVLSRFPALTTTFTAFEMATVQEAGIDVFVATIWTPEKETTAQSVEKQFEGKIKHLSLLDPVLWLRAIQQFVLKPSLWGLTLRLLVESFSSIYAVLKILVSVPKGLYLGYWIKEHGIQHIHSHFLTSPTTVALVASKVSGIPYTVTIHAHDIFATDPVEKNTSVQLKLEQAAANIVISQFNLQFIRSHWPKTVGRFEVIYNGIDVDFFSDKLQRIPDPDLFRIVSTGRLVFSKGHTFLIEAVAMLLKKGRKVRLEIIGHGPYEPELRKLIDDLGVSDHVSLLGPLLQEKVIHRYQECDLFVLACAIRPDGDRDGLPTVLIESLAMQIPTISTQVSGVPEVIQHNVTGLCIPPHDSSALADSIEYAMDHPAEMQQMAKQGRDLVVERFNRVKNTQKVMALWKDIAHVPQPSK